MISPTDTARPTFRADVAFGEGWTQAPVEAMACGLPAVVTSATGVRDVVADAAVKVPIGDARAVADAVERLCSDSNLLAALSSARARARAKLHLDGDREANSRDLRVGDLNRRGRRGRSGRGGRTRARALGWQRSQHWLRKLSQAAWSCTAAAVVGTERLRALGVAAIVFKRQNLIAGLGMAPAFIHFPDSNRLRDAVDSAFLVTAAVGSRRLLGVRSAPAVASLFDEGFARDVVARVRA